ncbi:glycosyltransferase [Streptomyces albus subsp. chlorinus]|uniref:glycosyltransferase family 2 protein n=1 Tax=Streptomyces albus TaxID=1888 RepID=UPI00156DFFB1|nr:glycosyltransferase [Streptomyces albus]NSC21783.1 glycosyltransferase [Streptomyces albus subsp. chlorinus]
METGGGPGGGAGERLGVVIATRDRRDTLARTLERLLALPENPRIMVVDNASRDGTADMVTRAFPGVDVLRMPVNRGALARNAGVRALRTPYVAFSDDDSWWEPGSLGRAVDILAAHPAMGLLAAGITVEPGRSGDPEGRDTLDALDAVAAPAGTAGPTGPERSEQPPPPRGRSGRPDPLNGVLAASPLGEGSVPGSRKVLGFLGCAAVVRRQAYLDVGGYHPLLFFGAEETLLAYDLAAAGWEVVHCPDVVARHSPADVPRPGREALVRRNELLIAWLRRPLPLALRRTASLCGDAVGDAQARRAARGLLPRLPAALRLRRPLPPAVEEAAALVEAVQPPRTTEPARPVKGATA